MRKGVLEGISSPVVSVDSVPGGSQRLISRYGLPVFSLIRSPSPSSTLQVLPMQSSVSMVRVLPSTTFLPMEVANSATLREFFVVKTTQELKVRLPTLTLSLSISLPAFETASAASSMMALWMPALMLTCSDLSILIEGICWFWFVLVSD